MTSQQYIWDWLYMHYKVKLHLHFVVAGLYGPHGLTPVHNVVAKLKGMCNCTYIILIHQI